ncbi:hypothetical protein TrVGV298_011233 [Trichoderma virens]|nr:hypothetical protein TrVGV298_011233 [Trichoderma virens]
MVARPRPSVWGGVCDGSGRGRVAGEVWSSRTGSTRQASYGLAAKHIASTTLWPWPIPIHVAAAGLYAVRVASGSWISEAAA